MNTDKENFWRVLKGEEGIMRFRCRIGIHKWTTWTVFSESRLYGGKGTKFHYRKTCVCCKLVGGMNKIIKHERN